MKSKAISWIIILLFLVSTNSKAQNSYLDPAEAYNKLTTGKNGERYLRVGNFKVTGTPYLFGEELLGIIYANSGQNKNVNLKYNIYSQHIEFPQAASETIFKDLSDVDSFLLIKHTDVGLMEDMKFVNSKYVDPGEKYFLHVITTGKKFSLYKTYKSTLQTVTTNYVQRDLREFTIEILYWYIDHSTRKLKKLKGAYSGIYKEFKDRGDISNIFITELYNENPGLTLKKLFEFLNR